MATKKEALAKLIDDLETEPIFSIHIDFADGSNDIIYYNLNLKQAAVVLQDWGENWILTPDADCKLNAAIWNWHARARSNKNLRNLIDNCDESETIDDDSDVDEAAAKLDHNRD